LNPNCFGWSEENIPLAEKDREKAGFSRLINRRTTNIQFFHRGLREKQPRATEKSIMIKLVIFFSQEQKHGEGSENNSTKMAMDQPLSFFPSVALGCFSLSPLWKNFAI
jgi:hypothetical protein